MDRGSAILQERLRTRRGRQAAALLRSGWGDIRGAGRRLELLRDSLASHGAGRRCLLDSPLLGGWLQDLHFWRQALDRAAALRRGGSASAVQRLFEQMAKTEFLLETVPAGAVDGRFARRVRRRARAVLRHRMEELPRILWPHLPAGASALLTLRAPENPDEGMPAGRVRLGLTAAVLWDAGSAGRKPIVARWRRGCLVLPPRVKLVRHETVPGSSILLAHRLVSASRALRVGGRVPGLGARLARGLALLRRAWPRAEEEVRRRTWLIVPLVEPGTVSYSHLARPGISYLNVFRGSLVDLADDLLHETAHHRLHAWQETVRFSSLVEERRYFSPWRRTLRPLNGILHGAYTFLFRAELLLRLSRDAALPPARRRRLRREAAIERRHCAAALADLARARRGGELTRPGRDLVRAMAGRLRRLEAGRLSGRFEIGIF